MIKLHPETAAEISNLINEIDVSAFMRRETDIVGNKIYWSAKGYKAEIEMFDLFGIKVCGYDQAIKNMQRPMYKRAKLIFDE